MFSLEELITIRDSIDYYSATEKERNLAKKVSLMIQIIELQEKIKGL